MLKEKGRVLVADDTGRNLRMMETMLSSLGYEVILARDGEEALARVKETSPSVILLDTLMPKTDGFEVARRLKEDVATRTIPIVMMTTRREVKDRLKALEAGADDFLTRPVELTELRARVNSLLKVKAHSEQLRTFQEEVEGEVARRTQSLKEALERARTASLDTIYRLSRAAEYKDEKTGAHVQRMSHYCSAIARAMRFGDDFVECILWAAPMHDVGKIGIPDRILQKPGKLDADEWEIMKQHPIIGAEILRDARADFVKLAADISLTHHEKWDGSGYPQGLEGVGIPDAGRIVAVADVFDALTSERAYRTALPLEEALAIVREGRESHFDPSVVDAFLSIQNEIAAELNWWRFISSDSTSGESGLPNLFG